MSLTINIDQPSHLEYKTKEFTEAIQKYLKRKRYKQIEKFTSCLIVTLQVITLLHIFYAYKPISYMCLLITLVIAYLMTDFINGLVHMYMDNNTNYSSLVGPFVAAFHLHHAKYVYRRRNPFKVYFDESGTKFWLLVYLFFLTAFQLTLSLNIFFDIGFVAFGIFSSVAELSHYWCHNATKKNKMIMWLQNHFVLLSKEHHKFHHSFDNIQYAFLNGISDPIINILARYFYKGYKNHADKHTAIYLKRAAYKKSM